MESFLGQICLFGFNFQPQGWAFCNGQSLSIAQNSALFALLGTTYGGNGTTNFNLPNLQGRVPMHFSANHPQGQAGGAETVAIGIPNLPPHTHGISATGAMGGTSGPGSSDSPVGNIPASSGTSENYAAPGARTGDMAPIAVTGTTTPTGSGAPIPVLPPFLTFNFCIALQGIFPSRN